MTSYTLTNEDRIVLKRMQNALRFNTKFGLKNFYTTIEISIEDYVSIKSLFHLIRGEYHDVCELVEYYWDAASTFTFTINCKHLEVYVSYIEQYT